MSIPLYWPKEGGEKELNPLVSEALAAAKKGVKVRILINPSYQAEKEDSGRGGANPPPYDAEATLAFLRQQTTKENLPLEVAIMNNEALQLVTTHNKGMLADGKRAFVSSINGTWNSVANNREIAVALDSPAAAQYYGQIFQFDWSQSAKR